MEREQILSCMLCVNVKMVIVYHKLSVYNSENFMALLTCWFEDSKDLEIISQFNDNRPN